MKKLVDDKNLLTLQYPFFNNHTAVLKAKNSPKRIDKDFNALNIAGLELYKYIETLLSH